MCILLEHETYKFVTCIVQFVTAHKNNYLDAIVNFGIETLLARDTCFSWFSKHKKIVQAKIWVGK